MQDASGKLYGTSIYSGNNDNMGGVVFEFNPTGNVYTPVYRFDGAPNGAYPIGSLIQGYNGMVYSMTSSGGANSLRVIFSVDAIQHTFTKLYDFESTNGASQKGAWCKVLMENYMVQQTVAQLARGDLPVQCGNQRVYEKLCV